MKPTFQEFIKHFFPEYIFDEASSQIVASLNMWANRDGAGFNQKSPGWHIDKGLLLVGPVGAGKTDLMKLLRNYLIFLKSNYQFDMKIVWKFAKSFQEDGYKAFDSEETGNRMYDELALFDDKTGNTMPTREFVSHFGNKLLIGSELIMMRYEVFKYNAIMSHFTTNANSGDLERIYGERAFSRLFEMCNVIPYIGPDRRKKPDFQPLFANNKNKPNAPKVRTLTQDEIDENRMKLEFDYEKFCQTGEIPETAVFDYDLLIVNGVSVANDEELKSIVAEVTKESEYMDSSSFIKQDERNAERKSFIWKRTRELAVQKFYQRMKDGGAKSIFKIVPFTIPNGDLKKENGYSAADIVGKILSKNKVT